MFDVKKFKGRPKKVNLLYEFWVIQDGELSTWVGASFGKEV